MVDLLRSRPPSVTDSEIGVVTQFSVQLVERLECLKELYVKWQRYTDERAGHDQGSYSAPLSVSSGRGRPKFVITQQQLHYLCSISFSWSQIAKLSGVSYMTVYRRCQEFGMPRSNGVHITDNELRVILHQLRQDLPSLGQTMVWGRLRSMGFHVTRERIRQAMRETDAIHTALRWHAYGEVVRRHVVVSINITLKLLCIPVCFSS